MKLRTFLPLLITSAGGAFRAAANLHLAAKLTPSDSMVPWLGEMGY